MDEALLSHQHKAAQRWVERTILASRWLLAPFYAGLGICLVVLLINFTQKMARLVGGAVSSSGNAIITTVLSLVDLALVASLVLMIMLASMSWPRRSA